MKIESIIKRKKGTVVKMDNPTATYKFLPESGDFEDPHVAVVEDEGHARLFLSHPEAFALHEGKAPEPLQEEVGPQPLGSSLITGQNYTIVGGDTVELQVLINMAFDDSELEVEDWNNLSDQERADRINVVLAELKGKETTTQEPEKVEEKPEEKPEQSKPEAKPETGGKKDESKPTEEKELNRDELVEQFQKKFGRKPHYKMKAEDIARAISKDD